MKTIDEVSKELGIDENILQNWEKKGFLGEVAQVNGKITRRRIESYDQVYPTAGKGAT